MCVHVCLPSFRTACGEEMPSYSLLPCLFRIPQPLTKPPHPPTHPSGHQGVPVSCKIYCEVFEVPRLVFFFPAALYNDYTPIIVTFFNSFQQTQVKRIFLVRSQVQIGLTSGFTASPGTALPYYVLVLL